MRFAGSRQRSWNMGKSTPRLDAFEYGPGELASSAEQPSDSFNRPAFGAWKSGG